MIDPSTTTPDSEHHGFMAWLPRALRPFALLARFDRPIGCWLLYWPCVWGVLLVGHIGTDWILLCWFLIGSIAMRSAGCVYNDIIDRDLDRQVARTRNRPLPSGSVSVRAAWAWLVMLCLIGLVVLLQLPRLSQIVAMASLAAVAAYPFMKRITWWPQAWLGIVFSWGALVAWTAVTGRIDPAMIVFYSGCIAWVIGYDTIYALQDVEDDALIGVRSSARRMGTKVRIGVAACYAGAMALWATAFWMVRPDPLTFVALLPTATHLAWQVVTLAPGDGTNALTRFRSNRDAGLLMGLACLVVGL